MAQKKTSAQLQIGSPDWHSAVQEEKRVENERRQRERQVAVNKEALAIGAGTRVVPAGPGWEHL